MGKNYHQNNWCQATFGVDLRFRHYSKARNGVVWQPDAIAILGCPAVLKPTSDHNTREMYEPHMDRRLTAYGGNHQGSDWGPLLCYRRNYTFVDGHTVFVFRSPRPPWAWVP
jgi:hypothetical protein